MQQKTCSKCDETLPVSQFHRQVKGKYGVTSNCKACTATRAKEWRAQNYERATANVKAYYEANRERAAEYGRQWRAENAKRLKEQARAWTQANMDSKRASTAKRRANKLRAMPPWANKKDITGFYKLAARLTRTTGIRAEVDHIVPLQSPIVCGLHIAANLTVSTLVLNRRKGNLWWPDMPEPITEKETA